MGIMEDYPIVEYAHKIGKNTAEFTASDMARFMRWWMKQPQRKDILAMKITKDNKTGKGKGGFEKFQQNKKQQVVEQDVVEQDGELEEVTFDEGMGVLEEGEVVEEEVVEQDIKVVVEIGLTKGDVEALKWGIEQLLETFDFSEMQDVGMNLTGLQEVLNGIELE